MVGKDLNKEEAECFVDLVSVLGSSDVKPDLPERLAEGISKLMNKFISDEGFCEKCTNVLFSSMNKTESKSTWIY